MLTALLVGIGFVYLMRNEAERLELSWRAQAVREAEMLAGDLVTAVLDLQDSIGDRLKRVATNNPREELLDWARRDSLIRNVFVWREGALSLPNPDGPLSAEDSLFIQRYGPIFSGVTPWSPPDTSADVSTAAAPIADAPEPKQLQEAMPMRVQTLAARARMSSAIAMESAPARLHDVDRVVWKPWYAGEDFFLLGYAIVEQMELVYGIEIEFAALLGRLVPIFSIDSPQGLAFGLRSNRGHTVLTTGSDTAELDSDMLIERIPLAPVLPNWQIEVYRTAASIGGTGREVLAVGAGLGLMLVLSIIACGSMLFWLARRNMIDAARKTSFVSNVSHELKTPLTTIRMHAEMLGERRVADPRKREHYLDVIIEQSHRLTRLVNNVLDFSRIEQDRKQYVLDEIDPAQVAAAIVNAQRPRIESEGLRLDCHLPQSSNPRNLDRDAFEQVLLNLVDNAVKYARAGGELSIAWQEHGHIAVCDRGPGIPHGQRERVFSSYHRIDDSLTARQSGSGLGLTIARQLMRDMGGDVVCQPRTGGGACFVIVLPPE